MKQQLESIRRTVEDKLKNTKNNQDIENIRIKYLGKKGELTSILKQMGKLSSEERPLIGKLANEIRSYIENQIQVRAHEIKSIEDKKRLQKEKIDVTLPGKRRYLGHKHPITIVLDEIKEIFLGMGFNIAEGPEVEYDYYNFEALNMPQDHPARDTQDTFYINNKIVLRTQTSPMKVRVMESQKPTIRIISN